MGRGFTNQEMSQAKGVSVAVISNAFWRSAFGGDPHILGKSISLSGERYQVIGVMRPGAQAETPAPIDVWLPFYINPNSTFQAHYFQGVDDCSRVLHLPRPTRSFSSLPRNFAENSLTRYPLIEAM